MPKKKKQEEEETVDPIAEQIKEATAPIVKKPEPEKEFHCWEQ